MSITKPALEYRPWGRMVRRMHHESCAEATMMNAFQAMPALLACFHREALKEIGDEVVAAAEIGLSMNSASFHQRAHSARLLAAKRVTSDSAV